MKAKDIQAMLATTGIPFVYHHYPQKKVPPLPFGAWLEAGTDNFGADNKVHSEAHDIRIEFYARDRDWDNEALIESTLDSNNIFWNKECDYLNDEKCYITIYYLEV